MPEDPKPNSTEVYAIHGAEPEVLAYAMAKYSRSALTMRESLVEISSQKAEQFLNTFYFQYGHRSIADLAHIPFADRAALAARRDRAGGRDPLGRTGALNALSGLPALGMVHANAPGATVQRARTPPPSKPLQELRRALAGHV